MLLRHLASYIPKSPIPFSSTSQLLYSYEGYHDDKKMMKYLLSIPPLFTILYSIEFYLTHKLGNIFLSPLKLSLLFSTYPLVFLFTNKRRVLKMSLQADGQTLTLLTAGVFTCKILNVEIPKVKWEKAADRYLLKTDKHRLFLDQDGVIHDLELFYAVVRSLTIDPTHITLKE